MASVFHKVSWIVTMDPKGQEYHCPNFTERKMTQGGCVGWQSQGGVQRGPEPSAAWLQRSRLLLF